jgi:CRP-like cAMP-binding protein
MDVLDFAVGRLRDYITEADYAEVCQRSRRVTFNDGDPIHARGDPDPRLSIVAEGALRFGRYQPGGSFTLVGMVGEGAHFGDISLQRSAYTHDVFAMGMTAIDMIERSQLEVLLRELPAFGAGLWRATTARLNAVLELYDDARTLGVPARLAKVIHQHAGRGGLPGGVACLQRELAEILGVSQVSIGNALRELEKLGLVEAGYRCVMVPDTERLRAWLEKTRAV